MTVTIYEGDCRDYIPKVKADLIIMDPPYVLPHVSQGGGTFGDREYQNDLVTLANGVDANLMSLILNTLDKTNIYIWGNWKAIVDYLQYFGDCNTALLSWHKTNPVPMCSNKFLNDTEYCLFARQPGVKINGGYNDHKTYWVTPLNTADKKLYNHPTIKPVDIIRTMIRNSCPEGGTVFDPFMGSGTTGVAAVLEGRNFVGCEINPTYYETAKKRIAAAEEEMRISGNN